MRKNVNIPLDTQSLAGIIEIPDSPAGLVIFAHGSGSSRLSPRNSIVAQALHNRRLATLLFDLLTEDEDYYFANRFNIDLLTMRLLAATRWATEQAELNKLNFGYFGASTGAAAALKAAARLGPMIKAVVSRGGRPDLAGADLELVQAPTLLVVGGNDYRVIELNQQACPRIKTVCELKVVPGASHLFEEEGALEKVACLAGGWFEKYLIETQSGRK